MSSRSSVPFTTNPLSSLPSAKSGNEPTKQKSTYLVSVILSSFKKDGTPKLRFYFIPTFLLGLGVTAFTLANQGAFIPAIATVLFAVKLTLFSSSFLVPPLGVALFILALIAWGGVYSKRNSITISSMTLEKNQKHKCQVEVIDYFADDNFSETSLSSRGAFRQ